MDLCNFIEVQQISANPHMMQSHPSQPINVNVTTPNSVTSGTSLNSPDSSTTSSSINNVMSEKTNETDHDEPENEDYESELELTNLNWLTELKNITNLSPPDLPFTDQPTTRFNKFINAVRKYELFL